MVPAIAVPKDEPRFETLRERPDISPCLSSGNADCTMLTDGVSIAPKPKPIRNSPGANAQGLDQPDEGTAQQARDTRADYAEPSVAAFDRCVVVSGNGTYVAAMIVLAVVAVAGLGIAICLPANPISSADSDVEASVTPSGALDTAV